jgi:NADH-quinone oxidoreductase subunit M
MNTLLLITILAPFAGMIALLGVPAGRPGPARLLALLASAASAGGAAALAAMYDCRNAGVQAYFSLPWLPDLGIGLAFGVDPASLPLVVVSAVIGLAAVLIADVEDRAREFYLLLLATLGASLAAFTSRNLFFLYFFCEMTAIPKYLLTAAWGRLPAGKYTATPAYAAMQVTLFIAAGAMVALIALASLFVATGTLDMDQLGAGIAGVAMSVETQTWIYGAFLIGFGVWTSMWPLHTWSPLTYAAAPAPAAMVFAGIMKNFGAYALLRLGLTALPDGAAAWSAPLAVIGMINILYGGWAAMRQKDWTFIVAYSSISHVGYLLLAIAVGGSLGLTAATLFMVAHGLVVALLFGVTGLLEKQAGSRHVDELGGLARSMPFIAMAMAVAVIAASGIPGFANFVAELTVFVAAWSKGTPLFYAAAAAAVWGIVITATYFFRALRSTFYGPAKDPTRLPTPRAAAIAAVALLVAASFALGAWPRLVTDLFKKSGPAMPPDKPLVAKVSSGGVQP